VRGRFEEVRRGAEITQRTQRGEFLREEREAFLGKTVVPILEPPSFEFIVVKQS
jgi:hypothetical protein